MQPSLTNVFCNEVWALRRYILVMIASMLLICLYRA